MKVIIAKARRKEFHYIQEKIGKYLLDGTEIDWRQFFAARIKDRIVAFGRLIDHGRSFEVATLGVDYYHRGKGIGKKMLQFLVLQAKSKDKRKPIYGVTHLPEFVSTCGFAPVGADYPAYLDYKRKHICRLDASRLKIVQWKGRA